MTSQNSIQNVEYKVQMYIYANTNSFDVGDEGVVCDEVNEEKRVLES